MRRPIVSILIPVYNVENYLEKCLDSVTGQTLTNIEIICVNDGSTDSSAEILEKYKKKDSRIKIINKDNGGLPSARNAGLDVASGKYVGFVDADDYIQPDMYKRLVEVAESEHSEVVICGANIFPEEPKADAWLYSCLSPWYKHYDEYDPELIYWRQDTNPFLWRVMIKKDLIDREMLRLEESIIVGEDKAFQAKVYPAAKGISVIPDKLYNYLWCRPDSLMDKFVYGSLESRILNHTKLVVAMGKDTINAEFGLRVCKAYLEWAISFIYDDFIYLDVVNKVKVANELIPLWKKMGYYTVSGELPEWKILAFEYIQKFEGDIVSEPELSIIVPIEQKTRYVDDFIRSMKTVIDEMNNRVELIVINNGMTNENYIKVQNWLYTDKHVRLYNTPKHVSYAESLNLGIGLSQGAYVAFMEASDWYTDSESLSNWLDTVYKNQSQICVCNYVKKASPYDKGECKVAAVEAMRTYSADYGDCLYEKEFIVKNEIKFSEHALVTGYAFMCSAIVHAERVNVYDNNVYVIRDIHKADWLRTDKCEQLLDGLKFLMELSVANNDKYLHGKVISLLNGDVYKRLIVNNTKPYTMPTSQCPNGENSQIKTVYLLFTIASMVDYNMLHEYGMDDEQCAFDTLYEVIKERHAFIGKLSDELKG